MAQFFSYPYNYLQNFEKSTEGSTESDNTDSRSKANIVSNKNLNDSVESKAITFDFVLNEGDSFDIDSIQIVSENVKEVKINNKSIGFLEHFGPMTERSGLLYTIDTDKKIICSMDLTGRIISQIKTIISDDSLTSFKGFANNNDIFWFVGGTSKLYEINLQTGITELIQDSGSSISAGPIAFHKGELYMVNETNLFTFNFSTKDFVKKVETFSLSNFKDLASFKKDLYVLYENTIQKINTETGNLLGSPIPLTGTLTNPTGLASNNNNLYLIDQGTYKTYKITNPDTGTTEPVSSSGKQYLFSDQFIPVNISSTENLNQLTLNFEAIDGIPKTYQVLLLKKKMEIRYSSPTPGFGNPYIDDSVPGGEVVQPSDFSQIEPTQNEQGLITHQNTYGQRIKQRAYASHAKYQTSYTLPIRTLKQVRALQNFRENNLNFTFAQNTVLYPDRIYPAHFSSFDLPINYISKTLAQDGKYTFNFTITEN